MRAVDTNVLIRLVVRDDAKHVAAAETFVARGAWVPHLVLLATTWVLTSVSDREPPDMNAETRLNHEPDAAGFGGGQSAVASFRAASLGFSDCLV